MSFLSILSLFTFINHIKSVYINKVDFLKSDRENKNGKIRKNEFFWSKNFHFFWKISFLKKWKVNQTTKSIFEKPSKKSFSGKNLVQKKFFAQELLKNYFLSLYPYIPNFMQLYMHFLLIYIIFMCIKYMYQQLLCIYK